MRRTMIGDFPAIGLSIKSMFKKKLTMCHVDQLLHTTWHPKRQNFQN